MHKVEVGNLFVGNRYIWIKVKRSSIPSGRRLHPCQSTEKTYKPIDIVKGIKVGDILRSDTLPFMSRPRPIYKTDKNGFFVMDKTKREWKLIPTHLPFKLESGYWVLRKVA